MHDLPRQKLCEIVTNHGTAVGGDARRCEALLRDLCPGYKREISSLAIAARAGVPGEIQVASEDVGFDILRARLSRLLQDECALSLDAADWAVDTWMIALGRGHIHVNQPQGTQKRPSTVTAGFCARCGKPRSDSDAAYCAWCGGSLSSGSSSCAPARDFEDPVKPQDTPSASQETVNAKDGSVLLYVPGGTFTMGSSHGSRDEKPPHAVTLPPYWIGKVPVTNALFRKFVAATGYSAGNGWSHYASKWGEQAPVVCVSWNDSVAYCQWAGLRLPSEAEWEFAARGTDGREYPWGNRWDASLCRNSVGQKSDGPVSVGSYPSNASPFGCLDMAGNVWQWCSSKYKPYGYNAGDGREAVSGNDRRVLRGGSWSSGRGFSDLPVGESISHFLRGGSCKFHGHSAYFRSVYRSDSMPDDRYNIISLRVSSNAP